MSRASNARGMGQMQHYIMQWAIQKDAKAQQLKQAEAQANFALEKRKQDLDLYKAKLTAKDKVDVANTTDQRTYAEQQATKQAIKIADIKAKSEREALADQKNVGETKQLKGLPGKMAVYMGGGKWSVQGVASKSKSRTKAEITIDAVKGDKEAQGYLEELANQDVELAKRKGQASTGGKMDALAARMDLEGLARSIVAGKEKFSSASNTMGVPIKEILRKKILALDPNFNFVKPEVTVKGVSSSILQQQKQRGAAGSFIKNIDAQVDRITEIMGELAKVGRIGIRALDMPRRELLKGVVGSGNEAIVEAYLTEISNEIGKLSTNSQASVRELSVDAQEKWAKIHDPALSLRELTKILTETKHMGALRMQSIDDELKETMSLLDNINEPVRTPTQTKSRFKIIGVE